MNNGSFNWCFKVVFDYGTAQTVRLPVTGNVTYPEKVRREVAVMKYLCESRYRAKFLLFLNPLKGEETQREIKMGKEVLPDQNNDHFDAPIYGRRKILVQ
jgi:hypothetical protein